MLCRSDELPKRIWNSMFKAVTRLAGIGILLSGLLLATAAPAAAFSVIKPDAASPDSGGNAGPGSVARGAISNSSNESGSNADPGSVAGDAVSKSPDASSSALLVYGKEWHSQEGRERLMELYRMLRGTYQSVSLVRGGDQSEQQLREADLVVAAGGAEESFVQEMTAGMEEGSQRLKLLSSEGGLAGAAEQLSSMLDDSGKVAPAYLILTGISPFLDREELVRKGEWLRDRGFPFWMELRPIFVNTDMKSMTGYFEVLRELQGYGGVALLGTLGGWNAPDEWEAFESGFEVSGVTDSTEPEQLTGRAWISYVQQGVYPAGLSGPPDLIFDADWNDVLKHSDLFVENSEWKGYSRDTESGARWRGNYVPLAEEAATLGGNLLPAASSRVTAIDASLPLKSFQQAVEAELRAGAAFADPAYADSSMSWDGGQLVRHQGALSLNGAPAVWQPPPVPEQPAPSPEQPNGASDDGLTVFNKGIKTTMSVLFVISVLVVSFFVAAFVVGRQINRRKHMR
ncbi:hypothetical protein SAMN05444162_5020 [Paenibacillaceae bacterium GAS479]|nr:hypothetical protein SAMN05444162_5020 [Paenibacillaceae bacterium GAS479]